MSKFLLLTGLSLLVCGGAMYLVHAARHDRRWVTGSLFFPFVVPLYYRQHWEELHVAGLLQAAGLAMTVSGALMLLFQGAQPDGLVSAKHGEVFSSALDRQGSGFVDSERALHLLADKGAGHPAEGRIHGEAFRPDRVELVDGVLRLREGRGFFPTREIAIFLGAQEAIQGSRYKRSVVPYSPESPEIHLSWLDENGSPVTEVIRGGYRLDLQLAPLVRNKLTGYLQVTLPDRAESYVAGDIVAITGHLRYKGDEVDRHFDHEDTLRFVAEEYVRGQYKEPDIAAVTFSGTVLDTLERRGETLASVSLKDGRVGNHVVKAGKNEFGWAVLVPESVAATEAAGYRPVYNTAPPPSLATAVAAPRAAPVVQKAAPVAAARKPVERTLAFEELGGLAGQGAVVEYRDGRREQGVLRGLRKDRLIVEANKAGGVIEYRVSAAELSALRMNSGEVIRLAGAAASVSQPPATTTVAVTAADTPSLVVSGIDLAPFMNRRVKVTTTDGKTTVGVLRGVNKDRLVVETQVGAGKIDYNVPAGQLAGIVYANP